MSAEEIEASDVELAGELVDIASVAVDVCQAGADQFSEGPKAQLRIGRYAYPAKPGHAERDAG